MLLGQPKPLDRGAALGLHLHDLFKIYAELVATAVNGEEVRRRPESCVQKVLCTFGLELKPDWLWRTILCSRDFFSF